jgi:hypothetical protein
MGPNLDSLQVQRCSNIADVSDVSNKGIGNKKNNIENVKETPTTETADKLENNISRQKDTASDVSDRSFAAAANNNNSTTIQTNNDKEESNTDGLKLKHDPRAIIIEDMDDPSCYEQLENDG